MSDDLPESGQEPTGSRVMLLVDADNVSADVIEQALADVQQRHGAAHIRRAYCTAETAVKQARLFERLALRPMVNLTAGKNANDIALAVDAVDLAVAERPDVAVIVSSDSDFAPLAIRLREKGCRVEGYGQAGKTARHDKPAYDDFFDLSHRRRPAGATASEASASPRGRRAATSRSAPARATPAPSAVPLDLDLDLDEPAPAPAPSPAPARARRPKKAGDAATAAAAGAPVPADVEQILNAVPSLREGRELELGIVAERLRTAGLLGKNAASTRLFGKHKAHFVLVPAGKPNRVKYTGGMA
ncbi:MAG: NYN domain-containing protein [Ideonella sp.]|jgi:hypothetical protein|nr:NYN domain-containing protein [Ideonella sp.]